MQFLIFSTAYESKYVAKWSTKSKIYKFICHNCDNIWDSIAICMICMFTKHTFQAFYVTQNTKK